MPVIEPGRPDLKELKGLHLWQGGLSNCSQRCRIVLNELGIEYESHMVNLHAAEHATEEFHQINPNGVVPALIHDGTVVVNSVDIIAYLNSNFGNGSLRPEELESEIALVLEHADSAQLPMKYCTFEFLFQHGPKASEETFQKLMNGLQSESLRNFHREFREGFSRERIHEMVDQAHQNFLNLEESLKDEREWMAGDKFTLADVAWMPTFHRFDLIRWPLEIYPHSFQWFKRASERPSYQKALDGWEPQALFDMVFPALDERQARNDGIASYGALAQISQNQA